MGTDKALIKMNGETLLEKAVKLCRPVCSQILISSNLPAHDIAGFSRIADEFTSCGPMSGIFSCLKQAENQWSFVISVDSAFVTTEFISFLFTQTENADAVVPAHDKGKEPLIALYSKTALPFFKNQLESGEFKMHFLLGKINTRFVDVSEWRKNQLRLFHNINSPDDLISA